MHHACCWDRQDESSSTQILAKLFHIAARKWLQWDDCILAVGTVVLRLQEHRQCTKCTDTCKLPLAARAHTLLCCVKFRHTTCCGAC